MTFVISHRWGGTERNPAWEAVERLLDELAIEDPEHVSVGIGASGWSLDVLQDGYVLLLSPEEEVWHIKGATRDQILRFMRAFADGDPRSVLDGTWRTGQGS